MPDLQTPVPSHPGGGAPRARQNRHIPRLCGACGAPMDPVEDSCWKCGAPRATPELERWESDGGRLRAAAAGPDGLTVTAGA